MPPVTSTYPISRRYILICFLAVLLSWIFHELAHWTAGTLLGYKMGMSLNRTFPVDGQFSSAIHYQWVSAAGPLFTLTQALIIFVLMLRRERKLLYPFLFTCFYMRLFALVISLRKPNDEARISESLGWNMFVLPLIINAVLFFLLYKISRRYRFGFGFNAANFGLILLFSSVIILADQYLPLRIL